MGWWEETPITDGIIVVGTMGIVVWMNEKRKGVLRESWIYNRLLYPFAYLLEKVVIRISSTLTKKPCRLLAQGFVYLYYLATSIFTDLHFHWISY
ncbi:hypothetical protein [Desmospora activa]|uniref:Uncharacterized protein n=1 Tax=Desmospora activa DSM 45169 TaxID=1121389 RepID=A0A2T4Z3H8_9BACL|nr:hypothetical protein [Desmospora activa]PTM56426.1 hypothetical protein C8J48_2748 [Desmospora activa DSM 45169]